jgi:hypothetical protein
MFAIRIADKWILADKRQIGDEVVPINSIEEFVWIVMEDYVCRKVCSRKGFGLSENEKRIMDARIKRMTEKIQRERSRDQYGPYSVEEQLKKVRIFEDPRDNYVPPQSDI